MLYDVAPKPTGLSGFLIKSPSKASSVILFDSLKAQPPLTSFPSSCAEPISFNFERNGSLSVRPLTSILVDDEDALGDWTEEIYINSDLLAVKNFVCDEIPNQDPSVDFQQISVELGETVTGEFTATDDGDPFWFNLESEPNNGGTIELHGGRKRKFQYKLSYCLNTKR